MESNAMNELEMNVTLGILPDPDKNFVHMDEGLKAEITYLSKIFAIAKGQKNIIGSANPDMWIELVPWHSLN